ncbi:MAG: PHP domain-containing protein [Streptosporangiales bacterium]|nr:PHP domain-containing protein [Streptosporangiales bacterium]
MERIAFLLERADEPTYRVRAFRGAADVLRELAPGELERRVAAGTLQELPGIGKVTATAIAEAYAGEVPVYLRRLEATEGTDLSAAAAELRAALRGDLHSHSDWSDGGSPIEVMAATARDLGHAYQAVTEHSPRLRVANGLSAERLRKQLGVVRELNEQLAPFRLLSGIEVDILADGSLDQDEDLLDQLDVVVASSHSKLDLPEREMTKRMVLAVANPRVDVLGHCTGRKIKGKRRNESTFDAEIVFEACRRFGVAVEINCRADRQDPPKRLLRLAVEAGCIFTIDTDAHAPGQLDWQPSGCERAVLCGVPQERIVNTWSPDQLLAWTRDRELPG